MKPTHSLIHKLAWTALAALSLIVCNGKSYEGTLQAIDSSIHANIAMNLTAGGGFHLPMAADQFGGHWGRGFNDHPLTLFYWVGHIMRFFGPSAWSAKILPALFSSGCILLTAWLGTLLFSELIGLCAGIILALTLDFFRHGAAFQLDTPMLFFILGSFIAWLRGKPLLAGACAGLAVLSKTPVGFLLFPVIAINGILSRRREWIKPLSYAVAIGVLVVGIFWCSIGAFGHWDLVSDYWYRQVYGSAVLGRGENQPHDFFLFFRTVSHRYWPWLPAAIIGIVGSIRNRFKQDQDRIPLIAALVVISVISMIRFKSGTHYFLPVYPFMALWAAQPIAKVIQRWEIRFLAGFSATVTVLITYLLCTPTQLSPEKFPGLKRFLPLIASYGDCKSSVLFIEGYQPYGSAMDYGPIVHFYTDHRLMAVGCSQAETESQNPSVGWVIVSGSNFNQCLSPHARKRFPSIFRYGNQYLLSALIAKTEITDLTPLHRELQASTDCHPPAYQGGHSPVSFLPE